MERPRNHFTRGRSYKNDEITVYWKSDACIHASYCYRELIEVFDPGRRPWIDLSGSNTERIIEVVNMCPTEALSWKWNEDARNIDVERDQTNHIKFKRPDLMSTEEAKDEIRPVSVKIMIDGPVVVKGNFTIRYNGKEKNFTNGIISLCRCGGSNQMPFCDGTHRKIGFEDK